MKPTKEQWEQVASQLDSLFATVYFRCDGYLVSAGLGRTKRNRLEIVVYVNGSIKGAWAPPARNFDDLHEEARRFWFPSRLGIHKQKEIRSLEKVFGKRECKKRGYYDKLICPTPFWKSPGSFIKHIVKHNESIEIIDYKTYREALEARDES